MIFSSFALSISCPHECRILIGLRGLTPFSFIVCAATGRGVEWGCTPWWVGAYADGCFANFDDQIADVDHLLHFVTKQIDEDCRCLFSPCLDRCNFLEHLWNSTSGSRLRWRVMLNDESGVDGGGLRREAAKHNRNDRNDLTMTWLKETGGKMDVTRLKMFGSDAYSIDREISY